jgi:hypothetical protein
MFIKISGNITDLISIDNLTVTLICCHLDDLFIIYCLSDFSDTHSHYNNGCNVNQKEIEIGTGDRKNRLIYNSVREMRKRTQEKETKRM